MKIYRIERHNVEHFFAIQDDAMKAAREFAANSCDPISVEALIATSWPLTKRTLVDILNGEQWHDGGEVFYTAKPGLTNERQAQQKVIAEDNMGDACIHETPPSATNMPNQSDGEPLHAESVIFINPYAV